MAGYSTKEVLNGLFGEVWIDGDYVQEITSFEATISTKTETVTQSGKLFDGTKIVGLEAKGTLKANKISSRFIKLLADSMATGQQKEFTIISKLADPDSKGTERIKLSGVTFSELTLANWEHKKLAEESLSFNFTGFDVIDTI